MNGVERRWAVAVLSAFTWAGAALAQNNEFSILTGCVSRPLFQNCGGATQFNFAWELLDTRAGGLYVELPLVLNTSIVAPANSQPPATLSNNNIFFMPGLRYKLR